MDLLLNWVYYEPIGHVVEALKVARGITSTNENVRLTLLQNAASPLALAEAVPWIHAAVPMDMREVGERGVSAECYRSLQRDWDYVIHNELPQREREAGESEGWMETGFRAHREVLDQLVSARSGVGTYYPFRMPDGLRLERECSVRIPVAATDRRWAAGRVSGDPCIALLPAGSGKSCRYPSVEAWREIVTAIAQEFPAASFYLTGRSDSGDGQTCTEAFGPEQRSALVSSLPDLHDEFDVGLDRQLALLEACDLLISPHSGFSFLAPCVGTPWLAISGGDWCEYVFQEIPFWCDFPNDPSFPHFGGLDTWNRAEMIPGMSDAELRTRIPGILAGVRRLLNDEFDFAAAQTQYEAMLDTAVIRVERMPRAPLLRF